ncbi:MAG: hypothetical protein AB7O38_06740 [Pirellulaceae bacterium]
MRHFIGVLVLAAWALLFVGCGGGDSSEPGVTENTLEPDGGAALPGDDMGGAPAADVPNPGDAAANLPEAGADGTMPGDTLPGDVAPANAGLPGDEAAFIGDDRANDNAPAAATLPGDVGLPGDVNTDGGVPGAAPPPKPTTLDGLAKYANQQGRDKDAFLYWYAWGLTSDAGASEVLSSYQWVPALRRPALAVRWGIGMTVTAPPRFEGDPKPIGTTQGLSIGKRREGGGGAGGGTDGVPGGDLAGGLDVGASGGGSVIQDAAIKRYTGEFGEKVLQEFQNRIADGRFGKFFQDMPAGNTTSNSYEADPANAGLPGEGLPGGEAMGVPAGAARAGGINHVMPGLISVGTGPEKTLLEKARKEGLDVLALVNVKITINRANLIINETVIEFYDVSKPTKPLFKSRDELTNTKVELARQKNQDDGVDKAVQSHFEYIDKNLVVMALPDFPPDAVKNSRLPALLQSKPENVIPLLAELRFYHRSKLLSDEDTQAAVKQLLGNDESAATTLLTGSEDDRKKVLEKWLPRS